MRRLKISLKKYFYLTLIFALLLIFALSLREREEWKSKNSTQQQHSSTLNKQIKLHANNQIVIQENEGSEGDSNAEADDENDEDHKDNDGEGGEDEDETKGDNNTNNGKDEEIIKRKDMIERYSVDGEEVKSSPAKTTTITTNTTIATNKSKFFTKSKRNQRSQHHHNSDHNKRLKSVAKSITTKPWFFKNGQYYPKPILDRSSQRKYKSKAKNKAPLSSFLTPSSRLYDAALFPYQDRHSDRIVNQLMFVPRDYEQIRESGELKTILVYNGLGPWNVKQGRDVFLRSKCPVNTCEITANRDRASNADMILYKDHYIPTGIRRPAHSKQLNVLYYLECPYHTQNVKIPDAINWTATYRRDSDIVAPYEKWVYYDPGKKQIEQERNFALNKTKKVAWFVSNCGARNGRLQFAHELQKYIDVDIYGACGNYKCSRSSAEKCFELLDRDYKFYLAFENSNCKDYITEKFFVNALNRNILPIAMGARPEDYEVSAPYRSYIHVDEFASPRELADYLHILDQNDELYNSYFKWKGTGEFINTFFWCRVCAALHDEESLRKSRWYADINDWWRGAGVCTNGSWRNFKARKDVISDD